MLHLLQMSLFEVLTTLLFDIRNSRQLSLLAMSSSLGSCFFWRSSTYQNCTFFFGLLLLVYLHCKSGPSGSSANAALPPLSRVQTFYSPSAHFVYPLSVRSSHVCGCFSIPSAFFSPMIRSGFFNELLEVYEPGVLKYYTL